MKLMIDLTEEEIDFLCDPAVKGHTYFEHMIEAIRQKLVDSYIDEVIRGKYDDV